MLNTVIVFKSICGIFCSAFIFFAVGLLFNYLLHKRTVFWGWFPSYFYLVCGMLLTISAYAIVQTKGITILAIIPVLLVFLTRGIHRQFSFPEVKNLRQKLVPFLFLTLAIVISYLYYAQSFKVEGDMINYVAGDQEFYGRVAGNINALGVENMRVEYLYPDRFTVELYHYGDIWIIAWATFIASVQPVFGGMIGAFPLLMAISIMGIAAFFSHFILKDRRSPLIYLLLFCCFVGGFGIFFPSFLFPNQVDIYSHSLSNFTKLLWCAALIPVVFGLLLQKSNGLIVYITLIIGIGYINVFPALTMGTFLWMLYISWSKKSFSPLLKMMAVTAAVVLFLYLLYAFYPSLSGIKRPANAKANFSIASILGNLRTSLNIFIGGSLQLLTYLPPFCLLLIYCVADKVKLTALPVFGLIVYAIILVFSALVIWAALYTVTFESVQFFFNIFVVVSGLLSAVIYLFIIVSSARNWLKALSFLVLLISVGQNIKYTINVYSINKKERDALFGFVETSAGKKTFAHYRKVSDYTSDIFSSATVVPIPYPILNYKIAQYENFSLNVPFAKVDTSNRASVFQQNNIDWAPMSHFVKMDENKQLTEDELMQKFMRKNSIGFLCVPADVAIPPSLQLFTIDSLYTPQIGWKIYKCDYK